MDEQPIWSREIKKKVNVRHKKKMNVKEVNRENGMRMKRINTRSREAAERRDG